MRLAPGGLGARAANGEPHRLVLVLLRHRALLAFMFAVLLLEHLARRTIFRVLPMPTTEHAPGYFINLALVAVMVVGMFLSLRSRGARTPGA